MKGISTVLAVILIVIIVVALVGLTYTFAVTLFGTAAAGAEAGITETTKRMDQSITFVGAFCDSTADDVNFTIRHTGATYDIDIGDLSGFIDGAKVTTNPDIEVAELSPGDTSNQFGYIGGTYTAGDTVKITVSAPAASVDKIVTCAD